MASTIVVDKIQKTGGEAIQWPAADGAAGTVLRTTGSGVLEFAVDAGIASLAADTSPQLGGDLDCDGSQIQWSKGADVASATALVLLTDGNFFDVTGTVTITSFNTTGGPGTQIKLQFDAACLLTHHATDLKLPGGANITTAAGDVAEFIEYATGDYICSSYTRADGSAITGKLDATPNTDHTANGPQTNTLLAGYTTTLMDLVYLDPNGRWEEADADATSSSISLLGIALEVKDDGEAMNVALPGSIVVDASWSFGVGVPLYVHTTAGAITATKPTGSGDVVRTVGYSLSATTIFFDPSPDYVTLA